MENMLAKKYNPEDWQWEDGNERVYAISELSREDLMQVACECMEALQQIEDLHVKTGDVLDSWQRGTLVPKPV